MAQRMAALATAAERIDSSVPVAEDIGNTVLTDERPITRLAGPLFVLLSVLLVPWTVFIAVALPSRQLSSNYDIAWAGFDVFLCAGLAGTGYFALRRSRWLPAAAAATGTLLVVDAWFDLVTSPSGRDLALAIVLAAVVEVPLAVLCFFLARQGQMVSDERLEMLLTGRFGYGTGIADRADQISSAAARP
jgi:hypothetical protein